MKISEIKRRLGIAFHWQWRTGVLLKELVSFWEAIEALLFSLGGIVAALLFILLHPFAVLWRFTFGMVWLALFSKSDVMSKLEAAMPNKPSDKPL
jgi:hypothetical protein